ncbi:Os06g0576800 [Oryza sativa Japonica Group]|uniref:Os06g0576800 protein n=1 Tax=Oryza sativa subsp. japonica TaxID=39947 RepID=A0A0P0WY14_ORYSJ|nr:Os06g0576800 [Oryza sativa Japonica Group]
MVAPSQTGCLRGEAGAFGSARVQPPRHLAAGASAATRRYVSAAAASAYRVPEHQGHQGVPSVDKHLAPALPSTMMLKNWRMMWRSLRAPTDPRVVTYNDAQMSGEGYQAIVDGLLDRRGLVYTRCQVKNQILVLKTTHSFWRYLQAHIGLGRLPDGTIDAESSFWRTHTEDQGQDEEEEDEEEFQPTPISTSSQRSQKGKRPLSSNSSTLSSPVKKSKSLMIKIVKDIASTFKEAVTVNTKQMQNRASDKAAFSVKRCQELAFECGIEQTIESVYAMSKMFETEYQREFFCGQLTPELRLCYFNKWCKDNNLE